MLLTIVRNSRGVCCKTLSLNEAGELKKTSAAEISKGTARRVTVDDLAGFVELRGQLTSCDAVCYGVFDGKPVRQLRIKSNPAVDRGEAVARTRDHFKFPSPAVLFIDCDMTTRDALELDGIIASVWPDWANTARVWEASSGSFIYTAEGKPSSLVLGWHAYTVVDNGAVIPDLTDWLHRKLWAAGHGRIGVSTAGSLLERGLIDVSVAQPERLDFTAPARLLDGLVRRAPEPLQLPGKPIADTALPLDDGKRAHTALVKAAKAKLKPEADKARSTRKSELVEADVAAGSERVKSERRWTLALEDRVLADDFELILCGGEKVTVGEVLKNPDKYEAERCHDPLVPDYRNDDRIAVIYPSRGLVYSHAHGGLSYYLGEPINMAVKRAKEWFDETEA
jgi:hypothetical protein